MIPENEWPHPHRFCVRCGWVPEYAWQTHLCTHEHAYDLKRSRPTLRGLNLLLVDILGDAYRPFGIKPNQIPKTLIKGVNDDPNPCP